MNGSKDGVVWNMYRFRDRALITNWVQVGSRTKKLSYQSSFHERGDKVNLLTAVKSFGTLSVNKSTASSSCVVLCTTSNQLSFKVLLKLYVFVRCTNFEPEEDVGETVACSTCHCCH